LLCFLSTLLILLCFALLCFVFCRKNLELHISYFEILEMGSLLPGSWWWPLKGSPLHRLSSWYQNCHPREKCSKLCTTCVLCKTELGSYVAHMLSVIRCWDWNPCTLVGLQRRNYMYSFFPETDTQIDGHYYSWSKKEEGWSFFQVFVRMWGAAAAAAAALFVSPHVELHCLCIRTFIKV
jgi:hypothetical protein